MMDDCRVTSSLAFHPSDPYLPPCRVCGEKASGFHYGVNTCEACKVRILVMYVLSLTPDVGYMVEFRSQLWVIISKRQPTTRLTPLNMVFWQSIPHPETKNDGTPTRTETRDARQYQEHNRSTVIVLKNLQVRETLSVHLNYCRASLVPLTLAKILVVCTQERIRSLTVVRYVSLSWTVSVRIHWINLRSQVWR